MQIILDICGWIGHVLKSIWEMRTNDGIVSFLMGNMVLIGGGLLFLRLRAKLTPGKKDDKLWSGVQKIFSFMAPRMKLPPEDLDDQEKEEKTDEQTS